MPLEGRRLRGAKGVDHFARTGVVQFFARLVLNRSRVTLQPLYMPAETAILVLKLLHLLLQAVFFGSFLLKSRDAIVAKHDAIAHPQGKHSRYGRGGLTTQRKQARPSSLRSSLHVAMAFQHTGRGRQGSLTIAFSIVHPSPEVVWKDASGIWSYTPESCSGGACCSGRSVHSLIRCGFAILGRVMRVLFVVLVAAFSSLVWASMAAARHIRRARRRHRGLSSLKLRERATLAPAAPPLATFTAPTPSGTRLLRPKTLQTYF